MNAISVVLGLALVASAHAQVAHVIPNYFLDLTIPSAAPTGVPRLAGGTGGSSNSQFQSLPIVLFLDHVETGRLTTEVTYQVTLRNVGDGPLTLPWSTDFAAIESFGQQPSLATLNLRILDNTLRLHRIGAIVLGGTSRVAGSTIVLKPNEIAVIKAKGLNHTGSY